jgi:hypothetical protein
MGGGNIIVVTEIKGLIAVLQLTLSFSVFFFSTELQCVLSELSQAAPSTDSAMLSYYVVRSHRIRMEIVCHLGSRLDKYGYSIENSCKYGVVYCTLCVPRQSMDHDSQVPTNCLL